MIGNASHLVPEPLGRVVGTLRSQASAVAVSSGTQSLRHLDGFKKLISLRLGKTEYQPS
jgi:hypothetical protein